MKTAKLALGLFAALALPSCFQSETTITLNKDGSGTIVEETLLGAQMMAMMTQFAQPGQPDPVAEMFKEEKARKKLATMGEGVEYVKTEMIDKDGRKGARIHYKFADINKISVSPGDAVDDMQEGDGEAPAEAGKDKDSAKFQYADGKLKIIVPPADFDELNMDDAEGGDPQQMAMMKPMLAEMRVSMKLVIADGIAETNASYVDGNAITLMDVQVGKMLDHGDAIKKIAETAKTDMAAAKAEFAKLDGIKMETKDDVTVTLK
ncbi:hypothetical protein HZ994_17905 [Akkermansiaceae bacterium]|nr:hypothetical protein HZ994_17905 [Akkermansiaceae bacterium]